MLAGGRGGSTYGKSRALNDVWRFTVASRSWTQLTPSGPAPLPRFLFGYDIFYPVLHQGSQSLPNPNLLGDSSATTPVQINASSVQREIDAETGFSSLADPQVQAQAPVSVSSHGSQASSTDVHLSRRAAGSMIVFGGESVKGCYLNDVWVLHLNSLTWHELSKPVACQKRCRSTLEQH